MDHIAIMKKEWGLLEKILRGEKTVESRWYQAKRVPWGRIKPGDNIYFKNSGEPVSIKARVKKVRQFADLTKEKANQLLSQYAEADLGVSEIMPEIKEHVRDKRYAIFVFFDKVERIKPFQINKAGFGTMSAWLLADNVKKIKKA